MIFAKSEGQDASTFQWLKSSPNSPHIGMSGEVTMHKCENITYKK